MALAHLIKANLKTPSRLLPVLAFPDKRGVSNRRMTFSSSSTATRTRPTVSYEELEARFPRQTVDLCNGETLSYVDCDLTRTANDGEKEDDTSKGPKHTLLVIPGYACDSKYMAFTLAQYYDEIAKDHRIVAVDPRGYGESTLQQENWSHEENAHDMKLVCDQLGLPENIMVMGYSTGGATAAWLTLLYPQLVQCCFLVSSIPLNGMRTSLLTEMGKATGALLQTKDHAMEYTDKFLTPSIHSPKINKFRLTVGYNCLDKKSLPRNDDRGLQLYHEAARMHRSRASALYANNAFNVTPIQTPVSPPNTSALSQLTCPMVVMHGANDALIKTQQVRAVTELAMVERWAPKHLLQYYEIPDCGHMWMYDNPHGFATTYRRALNDNNMGSLSSPPKTTNLRSSL